MCKTYKDNNTLCGLWRWCPHKAPDSTRMLYFVFFLELLFVQRLTFDDVCREDYITRFGLIWYFFAFVFILESRLTEEKLDAGKEWKSLKFSGSLFKQQSRDRERPFLLTNTFFNWTNTFLNWTNTFCR